MTVKSKRGLSIKDAYDLAAGDDHYRAYVGPPGRYDYMSASQFALLFHLGLREHHRVLDFGCGSLRLGRLLIPFLLPGQYYGIEPNSWLIDDAIDREVGRDAIKIKKPHFSYHEDFDCSKFGEMFDFIIGQSIATHCGPELVARWFLSVASALSSTGLFVFTYRRNDSLTKMPGAGWHYPATVEYPVQLIVENLNHVGLVGMELPWFQGGSAVWHAAALSKKVLPEGDKLHHLTGAVLERDEYTNSL